MPIEIIRCLQDNYAYLIHNEARNETTLIDACQASPIVERLAQRGWPLTRIYLTHHHWDHIDDLSAILAAHPAAVFGAQADAHRLPELDHQISPGDTLPDGAVVMDAPGHTVGHVAFHYPDLDALFSADSLMTHGCGRLFEGTPDQMFDTIVAFAALPDQTRIYCGHDYAEANLTFAARYAPDAKALERRTKALRDLSAQRLPTTGCTLAQEKDLNPYLRCHLPQVAAAAGLPNADPREVFAQIRKQKDNA